jgi:primosomal protein N'
MSNVFAEVVVDSYQDPTKKLFTYQVPENLVNSVKEGIKVIVPFGKRVIEGYVWSITPKRPPFPTKPIQAIKGPGFGKTQLKLAKWMAERYLASPLDCLKCQLGGKGEKFSSGPSERVITLILVPYVSQVRLRAATNKEKNTLIGSRSAIFAPLPNLQKIVVDEPENWNYKDERAPYYHAVEVAQKRAELKNLQVELRPQNPKIKPCRVVDLGREKLAGNFTLVSQPLESAISSGRHTIVYINSRELQEKIKEELQKVGADKNSYEIAGPELFSALGKESHYTVWADVDTLLNLPDFRAHEKIVWTIQKLWQITLGQVLLQTSFPQDQLFAGLAAGNLEEFHRRERENRQELGYPPFTTLVKLTFSAKTSAKVNLEAEKLSEKLENLDSGLIISPPYESYSKTPGKVQINIAVRTKPEDLESLAKLSKVVPPDWKVEVDPESLL